MSATEGKSRVVRTPSNGEVSREGQSPGGHPPAHAEDPRREGVTMALYVSIVLIAELAALPGAEDGVARYHGWTLLALVWGTAVGLALAHWFAFRLASRLFHHNAPIGRHDLQAGAAQVGGSVFVALACSVGVLVAPDEDELVVTHLVPAVLVGIAGYAAARLGGRSRTYALAFTGVVMAIGLLVAAAKNILAGH